MQFGTYVTFDEPLSEEEVRFIAKFNALFSNRGVPERDGVKIIYKPFNPEPSNPDLPQYNYSLGVKINLPQIPSYAPGRIKRAAKRLGIL
jgi:hypothetical protein